MIIDLVLVILILYFVRYLKSGVSLTASKEAASRLFGLLEPLFKEADITAKAFEKQLKEKDRLIRNLNERLDSRIISLNLLLNRAEGYLSAAPKTVESRGRDVYDQQKAIVELLNRGYDTKTVARKLSLPIGEVEMVSELKKKFLKLEQEVTASEGQA
ncbi:MAG: hypothetical protein JRH18_18435 [Deltaproteobacteria bacterium]|nr:hypothetical protein [Deltaproteobacteria bacterium]MBW1960824.1 hypothetical protein [Deltaproteobacteria bacterium]MBW1993413.1 hypothetical protein [Deltaproteobacteria bacterium]MBW2153633.1 hypothetical protein [Deltaproteobacteria bacterium]